MQKTWKDMSRWIMQFCLVNCFFHDYPIVHLEKIDCFNKNHWISQTPTFLIHRKRWCCAIPKKFGSWDRCCRNSCRQRYSKPVLGHFAPHIYLLSNLSTFSALNLASLKCFVVCGVLILDLVWNWFTIRLVYRKLSLFFIKSVVIGN